MLLALIIGQLSVFVAANPFHKYPFVYLLDVGNEELENTNSEQIRISIPGGSIALRYPAIGDGDIIGHIRVSGIDFGTDLKANIVDGGPGYKYVVLVFMGNPGVPYDAVLTVQTVIDQSFNIPNVGDIPNCDNDADQVEEDANNSAEDLSEDSIENDSQKKQYVQRTDAELIQASSNVYNYAQSEVMDQSEDFDEGTYSAYNDNDISSNELDPEQKSDDGSINSIVETENETGQENIQNEYSKFIERSNDPNIEVESIDIYDEDVDDKEGELSSELAQSGLNDFDEKEPSDIDSSNYNGVRTNLNNEEVYYEDDTQKDNRPNYEQEPIDYEDPDEIQPFFNDGEVHYRPDKYKDSNNNNYIDADDSFAVAY